MKAQFFKTIMVITLVLLVAEITNAQEKKSETPVQVQNLMKFLGKWEGDAALTAGGATYKVIYKVECNRTADGNGIIADEDFANSDLGSMKGTDLAGFDPYTAKIKWFTVDNMGTTHEHTGEWITPDHLYIEHNSIRDGKKYVEKIDFIFQNGDALNFKLVATLDGMESEKGEALFHRVDDFSSR